LQIAIVLLGMCAVFCLFSGIFYTLGRGRLNERRRVSNLMDMPENGGTEGRRKKKREGGESAASRRSLEKLADELSMAGVALRAEEFVVIWIAAALGIPAIARFLSVNITACFALIVVGAAAPILFVKLKRKKRTVLFDKQLVDALSVICSSLKAGLSFQTAMNNIAAEMEEPISKEFGRVYRETSMGMPLETSFARLVERTGNYDLELVCNAVIIQKQIGGNLAEVLENISGTISERVKLRGELKTLTSQGTLSGYIIGGLPVFLLLAMSFLNPDYVNMFFTTQTGLIMLAVSVALEFIGFMFVRKIVNIKM